MGLPSMWSGKGRVQYLFSLFSQSAVANDSLPAFHLQISTGQKLTNDLQLSRQIILLTNVYQPLVRRIPVFGVTFLASQSKVVLNVVCFTSQRFLLFNQRSLHVVSNRNSWSSSTMFRTKRDLWITKCYSKSVTCQIHYKFNPGIIQILTEFRLFIFKR